MSGGVGITTRPARGLWAWLGAPISGWWCVVGWAAATALFVTLVTHLGAISGSDTFESVFSTWAIGHGQLACAFPHGFRVTAPLYPLLSGGIDGLSHIGRTVPFPSRSVLGPHCAGAFPAINTWSLSTDAIGRTVEIGFLGWIALMAGVVALLRSTGRGRCGWEPATLILVAAAAPVWTCLQSTFHPEDLLALGLSLGAVACARRGLWAAAGLLIGLAFLSQQYALLIGVPLLILAPVARRVSYACCAGLTVAVVAVPLIVATSGSAAESIFMGTGTTGGVGGALVWELSLHGLPLLLLSRVAPLVLAGLTAWGTARRLGARVLEPVPLLCVVALSLALRLVFEQQIFEYYFMALTVALILLDVVRGRLRAALVAWLLVVLTVFLYEIADLFEVADAIRVAVLVLAFTVLVWQVFRKVPFLTLTPWAALAAVSIVGWSSSFSAQPYIWFWQIVLVAWGIALAGGPLLSELRRHAAPVQGRHQDRDLALGTYHPQPVPRYHRGRALTTSGAPR